MTDKLPRLRDPWKQEDDTAVLRLLQTEYDRAMSSTDGIFEQVPRSPLEVRSRAADYAHDAANAIILLKAVALAFAKRAHDRLYPPTDDFETIRATLTQSVSPVVAEKALEALKRIESQHAPKEL